VVCSEIQNERTTLGIDLVICLLKYRELRCSFRRKKTDVSSGWVGPAAPRQEQKKKRGVIPAGNQLDAMNVVDTWVKLGACLIKFSSKSFLIFTQNRLRIRRIERKEHASICTGGRSNRLF
jgi:hypothetical protein